MKDEIINWDYSDLFQLYFDIKPILGNLNELLSLIDLRIIDIFSPKKRWDN